MESEISRETGRRIVVIGATGFTGRLVARELGGGGTRQEILLTGRSPGKVDRLVEEVRGSGAPGIQGAVVDVKDLPSLAGAIRSGDVVINCAGPFAELGEPVVARCVEARASYVDTTGEQPWMREMRERYQEPASRAGVAVVNGMAFEWALGDCAAALLGRRLAAAGSELRSLDVIYAWGGSASSRGTRRTALRIMGTRGWELLQGEWHRRPAAASTRTVTMGGRGARTAVTFGAGEIVTVPRWAEEVETVRGWLVMSRRTAAVATVASRALPVLVPLLRPLLEPLALRAEDPTDAERADSRFTIRLEAAGADGRREVLEVRGTDPYGLTAAIAVAGAKRALEPGRSAGVLAPSQLADPAALLEALGPRGVELVTPR